MGRFVQLIDIQDANEQALADHVTGWHCDQLGTAPGYVGARVLAEAAQPGRYVVEVDFVSEEEARENNARPETAEWAGALRKLGTVTDTAYRSFREVVATDGRSGEREGRP